MQRTQKVQNVGTAERWLRTFALALGIALILLGAGFVFTGITGYCPLYNRLGWSTAARLRP